MYLILCEGFSSILRQHLHKDWMVERRCCLTPSVAGFQVCLKLLLSSTGEELLSVLEVEAPHLPLFSKLDFRFVGCVFVVFETSKARSIDALRNYLMHCPLVQINPHSFRNPTGQALSC